MEVINFKPVDVCSREMTIEHENGIIKHVTVLGGCSGNLQAICHLLEGMKIETVIERLENIKCPGSRSKQTSCPDQLAKGLKTINN